MQRNIKKKLANSYSTSYLTTQVAGLSVGEIIKELIADTIRRGHEEIDADEAEVARIANNTKTTIDAMLLVAETLNIDLTNYASKIKQNKEEVA